MKKTLIVYGSTTGNCESIAERIAAAIGNDSSETTGASGLTPALIEGCDNLILGSSTWGCGDLQDDWYDHIDMIRSADLKGKTAAVFGCGDSRGFSATFCDAMATLHETAQSAGARMVGAVPASDYTFDESSAERDGLFVGLALDEDNESDLTDMRIARWVESIRKEIQ